MANSINSIADRADSIAIVTVRSKASGELESCQVPSSDLPNYLHCFQKQWDFFSINHLSSIKHSSLGSSSNSEIQVQKLNGSHRHTQHHAIKIQLADETAAVCRKSGISFSVRLPSIYGTNLATIHPLAFPGNCLEILKQAKAIGRYPHELYAPTELAGMLLTLLRYKRLLKCKDFPLANLYLQKIPSSTLSSLLGFIQGINSAVGLPSLSLNEIRLSNSAPDYIFPENWGKSHATIHLLNWKRDCEEAQRSFSRSKIGQKDKPKAIKVFKTDKTEQQAFELKKNKNESRKLLNFLKKKHKDSHGILVFLFQIGVSLESLEFVTKDKRLGIASSIRSKFSQKDDPEAFALASLIGGTQTDAIEDDMISFSMQYDADSQPEGTEGKKKRIKVNFFS